ncbi:malate dehydrogenase [Dissostichus eleginoides]|uniref:Malate dehydrogenase n=1 Tax=Dissostichus eleginoides TaxID=100907 RepID=A0AAD9BN69_DISEL|nr:malate dehydrogenase [Dissostichus eleginoides]
MFFELCEEIWGGSPATRPHSSGIETGDLLDLEESSPGPSSSQSLERSNDSPELSESNGSLPTAAVVRHRRDLLQAQLNGHRSDRMKRKLPADHAVQEDLKIKKRMLDLMEQTLSRNAASMDWMNTTMDNINSTIKGGLSLIRELMHAPPHSSSGGYGHFH